MRPWTRYADFRPLIERFILLNTALALFALAMVLALRSNLGANAWTVLHDGIARTTPLTIGQATIAAAVVALLAAWLLGVAPGLGSVLSMLLVGVWMDVLLSLDAVPEAQSYPARTAMLALGALLLGLATALTIKAGFGAGPRDSLMLAVTRHTTVRVGFMRWGLDLTVVGVGILLGGAFGVGTLMFALLVGPAVELFFKLFKIPTHSPKQRARMIEAFAD